MRQEVAFHQASSDATADHFVLLVRGQPGLKPNHFTCLALATPRKEVARA